MSGLKILAWIICGVVGIAGITVNFYLDFRLWLGNVRGEPPPANIADYLWKATASIVTACAAAYAAFLVYSWEAIGFFWLFLALTAFVVGVTVVPMIYTYYFSAARMSRYANKARANDTQNRND
jgi:fatty acid desaturase